MGDQRKDVVEMAAAASLAVAGAAALPAAAIPGAVGIVWAQFQNRRTETWWNYVLEGRGNTPDELVARIVKGLTSDDENVIAGIVIGARAAAAAIERAAVRVIAVLSRRFLHQRDIPRWFYSGALEVLERVDAVELGALRRLLVETKDIRSDSITIIGDIEGDRGWRAFQTSVTDPFVKLTPFEKPLRLFGYLKRAGVGFDSAGFGIGGSPKVLVLDREPMDWMCTALLEGMG